MNIQLIEEKLPFRGLAIVETIQRFLGKQGGSIGDGQLKNLARRLTADERAYFAETFGLTKRLRPNGKTVWDGDLQTDQSIAQRMARLESGCCPVHGIPMYQIGSWQHYDATGQVVEEDEEEFCQHCKHCQDRSADSSRLLTEVQCLVCPIRALADDKGKLELSEKDAWLMVGPAEEISGASDERN